MASEGCASRGHGELWGEVAPRVGDFGGDQDVLDVVCGVAHSRLGVSGAAIVLQSECGGREIVAASGRLAVTVDELQYVAGEGPGLTAFAENRVVLVPDLTDAAERWPGFCLLALEAGVSAVFTFPLPVAGSVLATLDLHRTGPGGLTGEALVRARTLSELAMLALAQEHDELLVRILYGEGHYLLVHRAGGILAEQLDVSSVDASARLRAYAFAHRRSPRAVAEDIVAGRLRLERSTR